MAVIGASNGTTTTFYLTDALGSVLLSFSQNAILGEQVYGPYGASRYMMGNINTAKGYTGQFHDAVSGLDYYHARYYDPVVGVFLSVDTVQGNQLGFDPYAYVGGNPETMSDPTGHCDGWCWAANIIGAAGTVAFAVGSVVALGAVTAAIGAGAVVTAPITVPALAILGITVGAGIAGAWIGGMMSNGGPDMSDANAKNTLMWEGIGGVSGLFGGWASLPDAGASLSSNAVMRTWVASYVGGNLTAFGDMATSPPPSGASAVTPQAIAKLQKQQDTETAKALHMSFKKYKAFQRKNLVALDRQFTDEQQHYVQRWHAFLGSMRSQSHGSAYTPRQEAMINQWRHAYYA